MQKIFTDETSMTKNLVKQKNDYINITSVILKTINTST